MSKEMENMCAFTDKLVEGTSEERWEDVRATTMQECVDTAKEVKEEMRLKPKGIRKTAKLLGHDKQGLEGFDEISTMEWEVM